ncbi:MAG: TIGR02281 family clan AA aspartic protease, partial [Pseudomonadota bacterium]
STAKRIGLKLSKSDFRHKARTANGTALFARATIREIHIGGIKVRHVPAAVLDDRALDTTLLGMSFLNRLKRFEFKGNRLRLVQ